MSFPPVALAGSSALTAFRGVPGPTLLGSEVRLLFARCTDKAKISGQGCSVLQGGDVSVRQTAPHRPVQRGGGLPAHGSGPRARVRKLREDPAVMFQNELQRLHIALNSPLRTDSGAETESGGRANDSVGGGTAEGKPLVPRVTARHGPRCSCRKWQWANPLLTCSSLPLGRVTPV